MPYMSIYVPDLPKKNTGPKFLFQALGRLREPEQQIEKPPDRASYPRARNDATKLDLAIMDGELEKKEILATSSKGSDKQIHFLF